MRYPGLTSVAYRDEADYPEMYSDEMKALEPKYQRFVSALFGQEVRNYSDAYRIGIEKDDVAQTAAAVGGSRWAHRKDVQSAIQAESRRRMMASVPIIVEALIAVASDPTHKGQGAASKQVLDRALGPVQQEIKVEQTTHTVLTDLRSPEMLPRIKTFAKALNLDGDMLAEYLGKEMARRLGHTEPAITDADFVDVEEVPDFLAVLDAPES